MKKKLFGGLAVLLLAGLVLAGCTSPVNSTVDVGKAGANGAGAISWNEGDDIIAADLYLGDSDQSNSSGAKINNNAQSNDFPGVWFCYDGSKTSGYMKVDKSVFESLDWFRITLQGSSKYYECTVEIQPNQELSGDGCYVFFIDLSTKSDKKINHVFVKDYIEKAKLYTYVTPMYSGDSSQKNFSAQYPQTDIWSDGLVFSDGTSTDVADFNTVLVDKFKNQNTDLIAGPVWDQSGMTYGEGRVSDFVYTYDIKGKIIDGTSFKVAADDGFVMLINNVPVMWSENVRYQLALNSARGWATGPNPDGVPTPEGVEYGLKGFYSASGGADYYFGPGCPANENNVPGTGIGSGNTDKYSYPVGDKSLDDGILNAMYLFTPGTWGTLYNDGSGTGLYGWKTAYEKSWEDVKQYFRTGTNTIEIVAFNTPGQPRSIHEWDNSYLNDFAWNPDVYNYVYAQQDADNPAMILFAGTVISQTNK